MAIVGWAKNGSITAVSGSGISVMSDSLMAFQPAIGRAVEHGPFGEMLLVDDRHVHRDVLHLLRAGR
jgi:hypothetical protein